MLKKLCLISLLVINSSCNAETSSKTHKQIPSSTPSKLVDMLTAQTITAPTKKQPAKRIVKITNNIKPEMLVYKHWTGNKVPEPFTIIIEGKPLEPGKSATVPLDKDELKVQFHYSFMKGLRKGKREVTFKIPEKQEALGMTFSWDDDHRIIIDKAKAIKKI